MTRVPLDERRRLFLARQQANLAPEDQRLAPASHLLSPAEASHDRMRLVAKAIVIAMLVGAGLVVFHTVTFNLPTSVVEALLPRF